MRNIVFVAAFLIGFPNAVLAQNFICPDAEVRQAAEQYRKTLAVKWLGKELPQWSRPCPIRVIPAQKSEGSTRYTIGKRPTGNVVYGWDMTIRGSRKRMLDSVLPHEVLHTVLASHFAEKLPRWFDEGAASTEEHPEEIAKLKRNLLSYANNRQLILFKNIIGELEYRKDAGPTYAQGRGMVQFLIHHKCHRVVVDFIDTGLEDGWPLALRQHYGYESVQQFQNRWSSWYRAGEPIPRESGKPQQWDCTGTGCRIPRGLPCDGRSYIWDGRRWRPLDVQSLQPPPTQQQWTPSTQQPPIQMEDWPAPAQQPPVQQPSGCNCNMEALIKEIRELRKLLESKQDNTAVLRKLNQATTILAALEGRKTQLDLTPLTEALKHNAGLLVEIQRSIASQPPANDNSDLKEYLSQHTQLLTQITRSLDALSQRDNSDVIARIEAQNRLTLKSIETNNTKLLGRLSQLGSHRCSEESHQMASDLSTLFNLIEE